MKNFNVLISLIITGKYITSTFLYYSIVLIYLDLTEPPRYHLCFMIKALVNIRVIMQVSESK